MVKRQVLMCCVQYDAQIKNGSVSVADLAGIAAGVGLAGVEYREVHWRDKGNELPRVRDSLAEHKVRGTYATFTTLFNRETEARAQLLQDLEDAHAIGSTLLRVFRGERPTEDEAGRAMVDGARKMIDRAGELGIVVALENHIGAFGPRLEDVYDTLTSIDAPNLGANIDVSNYVLNDLDPIQSIRTLGPWVRYCHLKDVKVEDGKRATTYLGDGILDYRTILEELDRTGQDFPLCFEFGGGENPEKALRESLEYLAGIGR